MLSRIYAGFLLSIFILISLTESSELNRPRIAVFPRSDQGELPPEWIINRISEKLSESGRFEVVFPFSDSEVDYENFNLSELLEIAPELNLDLYVSIAVPGSITIDRTEIEGDTVVTYRKIAVSIRAWYFSGGGSTMGRFERYLSDEIRMPGTPDETYLLESVADELVLASLQEIFPVEVHFEASGGNLQHIQAGTEVGLERGMVLSLVARSTSLPTDPEEYEAIRSHGILQITDIGREQSIGRLISGYLVPGGDIIAVEHGRPALVSIGYGIIPFEIDPGEDENRHRLLNTIEIDVATFRWGMNFGGKATYGLAEHLSTLGISFYCGPRFPLKTPSMALRLSGGLDFVFLMQEVRSVYLISNANTVTFGGSLGASLEILPSDHFGLLVSAGGYLGTKADSWNVQDINGNNRDALPYEIYFTEFKRSPFVFKAGLFYLIY